MRRLLLLALLVPACCWLLWTACESSDYRTTLPFRSFDAAPHEAGPPAKPPDLVTFDQSAGDLGPGDAGAALDGGNHD
jgi:hypothetical protein